VSPPSAWNMVRAAPIPTAELGAGQAGVIESQLVTIGALITTYNRPHLLIELLESVESWTVHPNRIVVVNNGAPLPALPCPVELHQPGDNIGLPAAISRGFDVLSECRRTLVLDDDTILSTDTLALMLSVNAGAVSIAGDLARKVQAKVGGPTRLFPWSPTLFTAEAIAATGRPRSDLFFGWDDWEYALRLVAAGHTVEWLPGNSIERQGVGNSWPGRQYLNARNLAYIRIRLRNRDPVFNGPLRGALQEAAHPGAFLVRRGLVAGCLGQVGRPP